MRGDVGCGGELPAAEAEQEDGAHQQRREDLQRVKTQREGSRLIAVAAQRDEREPGAQLEVPQVRGRSRHRERQVDAEEDRHPRARSVRQVKGGERRHRARDLQSPRAERGRKPAERRARPPQSDQPRAKAQDGVHQLARWLMPDRWLAREAEHHRHQCRRHGDPAPHDDASPDGHRQQQRQHASEQEHDDAIDGVIDGHRAERHHARKPGGAREQLGPHRLAGAHRQDHAPCIPDVRAGENGEEIDRLHCAH